jgi:hypothetical protein
MPEQQWNWKENVFVGVRIYEAGLAAAKKLRASEQTRLRDERKATLKLINDTRVAHHLEKSPCRWSPCRLSRPRIPTPTA